MASMPIGRRQSPTRASTLRNRGTNNHTTISMQDDIKKVVEEVLEQKRLVPIVEKHLRRKSLFTENIFGKPLPKKFKISQITSYVR